MALNLSCIGEKIGPIVRDYTWKDVVLYALGVGAGFEELDYVYENQLKVIPSFAVTLLPFETVGELTRKMNADMSGFLHGGQETVFHGAIPAEGTVTTESAITHIFDKGKEKGAIIRSESVTFHSNGQKLFTNISTLMARKDGGFGGDRGPDDTIEFPEREPDYEESALPMANQPLFYRLSGDLFPLHVEPDFARASGFQRPIMHGLCTHGYACRAIIKNLFPGEPERLSRLKVRFARPLYPGVPIATRIWKVEEDRALFRVINTENGEIVIDQGIVEWLSKEETARRTRQGAINFDGRVAIVTGAGGGLGREYALELTGRGAKVVVNDFGGAVDGAGAGSKSPADTVVEEILSLGGEAVASYESVATPEGGRAIVDAAVIAFGRVDIVINNAGILRDKTLAKMTPENWDAVMDVHLKGAYNVTQPAFLKMRENAYGRIIFTTSGAGLYGNYGQTNYSAAKLGLVGFMNSLKLEGEKHNIRINAVAPIARSRMTEELLPPDMADKMDPRFAVSMVLYLCSEQCPVTGGIYNAGMSYYSRAAIGTGPGTTVGDGKQAPTPEEVAAKIARIKSLDGVEYFPNLNSSFVPIMDAFSPKKKESNNEGNDLNVKGIFEAMPGKFQADQASGVDVVFQYEISGPEGGSWYVAVKDGACEIIKGTHDSPTTTLKLGDDDFVKMMSGELNPMAAFTNGKLKIEGDLMKSQIMGKLFNI